ncbi:hypothetical protein SH611_17580 [Geminicoccaceae bacterium 1502E]|nr:hypothetical protein [Geminicoccaceae bacterium 1502E]
MSKVSSQSTRPASLSEIVQLVGGSSPGARHSAILATGATAAEIRHAILWACGEDEALGEEPPPLQGRTALVYDILKAEEPEDADEAAFGGTPSGGA